MKRREYLKHAGSTAVLPILADRVEATPPEPEVEDIGWQTGMQQQRQVMTVKTAGPVDSVLTERYEFGELSTDPEHKRVTDTEHRLVFDSPTTLTGIHALNQQRDGRTLGKTLIDFSHDLLTRHIDVQSRKRARVAVRQRGDAVLAAKRRAVITAPQEQPDESEDWDSNRHVPLLPQTTSYIPATVTHDALSAMRGHQTVWVWLQSEHRGLYPATVDFTEYDPVQVYELHGVTRY